MLHWKDDYLLNIEEIDDQHKELFRIAEDAFNLLKNEYLIDKYDRIVALINELKNYTVFHFSSEEEYMRSIGYQDLLSHRVEHQKFIETINNIDLEEVDESQDEYILSIHTDKLIVQTDSVCS